MTDFLAREHSAEEVTTVTNILGRSAFLFCASGQNDEVLQEHLDNKQVLVVALPLTIDDILMSSSLDAVVTTEARMYSISHEEFLTKMPEHTHEIMRGNFAAGANYLCFTTEDHLLRAVPYSPAKARAVKPGVINSTGGDA